MFFTYTHATTLSPFLTFYFIFIVNAKFYSSMISVEKGSHVFINNDEMMESQQPLDSKDRFVLVASSRFCTQ